MVKNLLLVLDEFDPIREYKIHLIQKTLDLVDIDLVIFLYEKFKDGDRVFFNEEKLALLSASLPNIPSPQYLIDGDSFENEKESLFNKIQIQKNRYKNSIIYLLLNSEEYKFIKERKEFNQILTIAKIIIHILPEDRSILSENKFSNTQALIIGNNPILDEESKASVTNIKRNFFNPIVIEYMNKSSECAIKRIKAHLSQKRFKHSLRVAGTIKEICRLAKIDNDELKFSSYMAGLYHDICKEFPFNQQISIAKEKLNIKWFQSPKVLHGPVATWYLKEMYFFEDEDILEAINYHTIPNKDPKMITMLLYLADHLEVAKKERYPEELYNTLWNLIENGEVINAFNLLRNHQEEFRRRKTI